MKMANVLTCPRSTDYRVVHFFAIKVFSLCAVLDGSIASQGINDVEEFYPGAPLFCRLHISMELCMAFCLKGLASLQCTDAPSLRASFKHFLQYIFINSYEIFSWSSELNKPVCLRGKKNEQEKSVIPSLIKQSLINPFFTTVKHLIDFISV